MTSTYPGTRSSMRTADPITHRGLADRTVRRGDRRESRGASAQRRR